jgi:hypothetical protein
MPASVTRTFLAAAFWAVGGFCVYWETLVLVAIHRFSEVDLPLIGKCSQVEAVIFTLSFFWAPLLVLHFVLHAFQRLEAEVGSDRPRFPGAVGAEQVPAELKSIRVCLFVVLFLWPTGIHVFLTGRAFDHFQIIPSNMADKPTDQWRSTSGWKLLFFPCSRPDETAPTDTFWWVNGARAELREAWPDDINLQESLGKRSTPEKQLRRIKVSAFGLQPLAFTLLATLAVWSSWITIFNGFSQRGRTFYFRRRKLRPNKE